MGAGPEDRWTERLKRWRMKEEQDGWTERGERDERTTAKRPEAMGGGRRRETRETLHHGLERSTARRLTEERWRKRGEGRKNGRQKVKVMNGGSNWARDLGVGWTDRWTNKALDRQKEGETERDGWTKEWGRDEGRRQKTKRGSDWRAQRTKTRPTSREAYISNECRAPNSSVGGGLVYMMDI